MIEIQPITPNEYHDFSVMVGELLSEIKRKLNEPVFSFSQPETEKRVKRFVEEGNYWVFVARQADNLIGFISLYESYALYSEGVFGTIPELYVRPDFRSRRIGKKLLENAMSFGITRGWSRLEVTTPPLPQFERSLKFYKSNGFVISGGRKLKVDVNIIKNMTRFN